MDEDYLIHYGVLGMKWGVRKSKTSGSLSKSKKAKQKAKTKDYIQKAGGKKKALAKATKAASMKANARKIAKKGAAYLTGSSALLAAGNAIASYSLSSATGIATAGLAALGPVGYVPMAAIGVGSLVAGAKAKKRVSRSDKKKISNIKNYK